MLAKAWHGGSYGIRVGKRNAEKYFCKSWIDVEVEIDGHVYSYELSQTFWGSCPEFRGIEIGHWLLKHGLAHWPKGKPPMIQLLPIKHNRFRLLCLEQK